jgi:hypothetical protein
LPDQTWSLFRRDEKPPSVRRWGWGWGVFERTVPKRGRWPDRPCFLIKDPHAGAARTGAAPFRVGRFPVPRASRCHFSQGGRATAGVGKGPPSPGRPPLMSVRFRPPGNLAPSWMHKVATNVLYIGRAPHATHGTDGRPALTGTNGRVTPAQSSAPLPPKARGRPVEDRAEAPVALAVSYPPDRAARSYATHRLGQRQGACRTLPCIAGGPVAAHPRHPPLRPAAGRTEKTIWPAAAVPIRTVAGWILLGPARWSGRPTLWLI